MRQVADAAVPGVNRNRAEVDEVAQRRRVVDDEVVHFAFGAFAPQRLAANPLRHELGRVALIERFAVDAVGETRQHERSILQIRQHPRRDRVVVVDEIALREAEFRKEDLVAVAHVDATFFDVDARRRRRFVELPDALFGGLSVRILTNTG